MKSITATSANSQQLEFQYDVQIPVPWGHMSAKVWGPDHGIPVLAIHGLMDNAGSFDTLAPLLPTNIRLVCLELCGHGYSSTYPPGVVLHYFDHAYHVKLVVDHFKWDKVVLLGHSIGAITLFLFASLFPENVSRMISLDLVKPFSVSVSKLPVVMRGIITQMREFSEIGRPLTVRYEEARQSIVDNYKGSVDEKAADILLVRSLKKKADAEDAYELPNDLRILVRTLTLSEEQIKVLVTNIRCPLLIIRASNGLKNFTEDVLKEYLDIYQASSADFRIVNVAGSHHVHLTHPERVAPHIHEFLLPLASFPTSKL